MDVGCGGAIYWYMSGSEHDSIEVGRRSLTVMTIELTSLNLMAANGATSEASALPEQLEWTMMAGAAAQAQA